MRPRRNRDNDTWRVAVLVPLVAVALWGAVRSPGVATPDRSVADPPQVLGATVDPTGSTVTVPDDRAGSDGSSDTNGPLSTSDGASPSGTVDEPSEQPVRITAVTPWVESEGEFQLRFEVGPEVPADAQLTYTIHQALTAGSGRPLRDAVTAVVAGGQPGRILQVPVVEPLSTFGTGDDGFVLSIPVRSRSSSDRSRVFLPLAGVHPISIAVTAADGPELWSTVVFLNHLPRDFDPDRSTSTELTVGLVTPLDTTAVFTTTTPEFDAATRSQVDSLLDLLEEVPSLPSALAIRGDLLAGLSISDDRWARRSWNRLRAVLDGPVGENGGGSGDGEGPSTGDGTTPEGSVPDGAGPRLVATRFTDADTSGIVGAGARDVLTDLVALGRTSARAASDGAITTAWLMDDRIDGRSAEVLGTMGVEELVVPASRLDPDPTLDPGTPSPMPSHLKGSGSIRVIGYDETLSSMLVDRDIAPTSRSHDVLTTLMADWFELDDRRGTHTPGASVVVVPADVDPRTAATLGAALYGSGPLTTPGPGSVLPAGRPDDGHRNTVSIKDPGALQTTGRTVDGYRETAGYIEAYRSAAPDEPRLETWPLRNAQSLTVGLPTEASTAMQRSMKNEITELVGSITPPPSRRLVLGARDQAIPLRFKNGLPYPVRLSLTARSPRLDMADGETTLITLEPGDNMVELPVIVRAPGESLLRINIRTPEGDLPVAAVGLPVRSTAISGVGAALSVLSITFLLIWWARTVFIRRRATAREGTAHPSESQDHQRIT